jgi:hypothetical protein
VARDKKGDHLAPGRKVERGLSIEFEFSCDPKSSNPSAIAYKIEQASHFRSLILEFVYNQRMAKIYSKNIPGYY